MDSHNFVTNISKQWSTCGKKVNRKQLIVGESIWKFVNRSKKSYFT